MLKESRSPKAGQQNKSSITHKGGHQSRGVTNRTRAQCNSRPVNSPRVYKSISCHLLGWASPKADPETRILVQIVYLGGNLEGVGTAENSGWFNEQVLLAAPELIPARIERWSILRQESWCRSLPTFVCPYPRVNGECQGSQVGTNGIFCTVKCTWLGSTGNVWFHESTAASEQSSHCTTT